MRGLWIALIALGLQAQDTKALAILQKHLRVRGGVEKLKAMKTLRIKGWELLYPVEAGLPWKLEQSRPNKFREEATVHGMVEVHTFNGTEGWITIPWAKENKPKAMTPEQVDALKENDFDDPWIQALEHPQDLHYQGPTRFNGTPVLQVQWTLGNGDELVGYFDQEVGLEIMRERIHREMGNEYKVRWESLRWQTVKGIAFPFETVRRAVARGLRLKILVESIEVDPVIPDARFNKP
jgi:hypothetical protein